MNDTTIGPVRDLIRRREVRVKAEDVFPLICAACHEVFTVTASQAHFLTRSLCPNCRAADARGS